MRCWCLCWIKNLNDCRFYRKSAINLLSNPMLLSYSIFQNIRLDAYCRNTKLKAQAALAHARRGQMSNSKLPEELRLKCLNIVSDQLHGFGPTLAHEKLTTIHGINISVETLRSWMIAADLWIPRTKRLKRPYQPRYNHDCFGELI
jgi:hypothetical protein